MKRCPQCDFTFDDSRQVCDFDGAELVKEPDPVPFYQKVPALTPATPSLCVRLKSSVVLAIVALVGVMSSALLIGYYDSTNQPAAVAKNRDSADKESASKEKVTGQRSEMMVGGSMLLAEALRPNEQPASSSDPFKVPDLKTRYDSSATTQRSTNSVSLFRRPRRASQSLGKVRFVVSAKKAQAQPTEQTTLVKAHHQESKVTSMLKTTWRVFKKPFRF